MVNKLIDKCNETIDVVKIVSKSKTKCNSGILYIVLFSIFFSINVGIGAYFAYYKYPNCNKKFFFKYHDYDYVYQTENC